MPAPRDSQFYTHFADEWIAAWNSHDLDRVLAHYDPNLRFSSPFLAKFIPATGGWLQGRDAVGAYWAKALATLPDLHFELVTAYAGMNSLVIQYRGRGGRLAAEYFVFGENGKVIESHAHYA